MQSDFSNYLSEDDPAIKLWKEISRDFQVGSTIIILIDQTEKSYDVRDSKVLSEMNDIYRILYERPIEEGEETGIESINSLAVLIRKENSWFVRLFWPSMQPKANGARTNQDSFYQFYNFSRMYQTRMPIEQGCELHPGRE